MATGHPARRRGTAGGPPEAPGRQADAAAGGPSGTTGTGPVTARTRFGGHRAAQLPARPARPGLPQLRHARTRLREHLPVDHRLSRVYRFGAGLTGLLLVAFGAAGLGTGVGFFSTGDDQVAGLDLNGALGVLSIVVGLGLFAGMVAGGNLASSLNLWLGLAFLLSGFANLAVLDTDYNVLNFGLPNVLFSFAVGLMLMTFGMYGRVGSRLPHDNPYWRDRHPEQAAREDRYRELARREGPGAALSPDAAVSRKRGASGRGSRRRRR